MAHYTIELGTIVRSLHASPSDGWAAAWDVIGLSGYPIWSEGHRTELNSRIIRHYFLREIGVETVEMFGYYVDEAMRLIMPAYNKLYESALIDVAHMLGKSVDSLIQDLHNREFDRTDSGKRDSSGEDKSTSSNTSSGTSDVTESTDTNSTSRNLDTPQSQVTLLDDGYLTDASKGEEAQERTGSTETSSKGSGTLDTSSTASETTSATRGETTHEDTTHTHTQTETDPRYYAQLVTLGRKLLDVDRMVIEDNELRQCFMTIY